jgi:two-component system response regulator MprA
MGGTAADKSVLIVEDDANARSDLQAILQNHGYDTVVAGDGLAAINLLRTGIRPRLILLDMILPGADGWQFFAERLRDSSLAQLPVVIMTGVGIASKDWARALGAADLIRKPIDVPRLLNLVQEYAGSEGVAP